MKFRVVLFIFLSVLMLNHGVFSSTNRINSRIALKNGNTLLCAWENRGLTTCLDFSSSRIPEKFAKSVIKFLAAGDLDKDGFDDMIYSSGENLIAKFSRDGTWKLITVPPGSMRALCAGDLNGDGTDEIIASFHNSTLSGIFRYNQPESKWECIKEGYALQMACGDTDGDQRDELAVIWQDRSIRVYFRSTDTWKHVRYAENLSPVSIAVSDMNNDGLADLLCSSSSNVMLKYSLSRYWKILQNEPAAALNALDFNRDGKNDLIFVSAKRSGIWANLLDGTSAVQISPKTPVIFTVGNVRGSMMKHYPAGIQSLDYVSSDFSVLCYNVGDVCLGGLHHCLEPGEADSIADFISGNDPQMTEIPSVSLCQEDFNKKIYNRLFWADFYKFFFAPTPNPWVGHLGNGLAGCSFNTMTNRDQIEWDTCSDAEHSDCGADKGFTKSDIYLPPLNNKYYCLHLYNLHTDAGRTESDYEARNNQLIQLRNYIQAHSSGFPLIIAGDFNMHRDNPEEMARFNSFISQLNLQESDPNHAITHPPDGIYDYILFRSGGDIQLTKSAFQVFEKPWSDHFPIRTDFNVQINCGELADLKVESVNYIVDNGSEKITATIKNIGSASTPQGDRITTDIWSDGNYWGTFDVLDHNGNPVSLDSGETFTGYVTAPPEPLLGISARQNSLSHTRTTTSAMLIKAQVDKANFVPEIDKTNNILEQSVDLLPDLRINDVWLDPANPLPGQAVEIWATVENCGNSVTAISEEIHVMLKIDGIEFGSFSVQNHNGLNYLKPGESFSGKTASSWTAASGEHSFKGIADSSGNITESNEQNNSLIRSYSITIDSPGISITAPAGEEDFSPGETINIQWTVRNMTGNVKIVLRKSDFSVTHVIKESWNSTGSPVDYSIPASVAPGNYHIKISSIDNPDIFDRSGDFSINSDATAETIRITSPNGNESWLQETTHPINWTSSGSMDTVRIEYSCDDGNTYSTIVESTENDGLFYWKMPYLKSDSCRIRISKTSDASIYDTSDERFSIYTEPRFFVAGSGLVDSTAGGLDFLFFRLNVDGTKNYRKNFGGDHEDKCYSLSPAASGGWITCGSSQSYVTGSPGTDTDVMIYRLDASGNTEWQKNLGGNYPDIAYSIIQTADNGYALTGSTQSFTTGSAGVDTDILVAKLDISGNIIWQKNLGGDSADIGYSIIQSADGGFLVCGSSKSFVTGTPGSDTDIVIFKLDSNGNTSWQRNYGGIYKDIAYYIEENDDGSFIITGLSKSFVSGSPGSDVDIIVYKIDQSGAELWHKNFGGEFSDKGRSIIQVSDGGYILCGESKSQVTGIPGTDTDIIVYKLDSAGNECWHKNYGGEFSDQGYFIQECSQYGYVLCGKSSSYVQGVPGTDTDFIIYRINPEGIEYWHKNYGGTEPGDTGFSIREITD